MGTKMTEAEKLRRKVFRLQTPTTQAILKRSTKEDAYWKARNYVEPTTNINFRTFTYPFKKFKIQNKRERAIRAFNYKPNWFVSKVLNLCNKVITYFRGF